MGLSLHYDFAFRIRILTYSLYAALFHRHGYLKVREYIIFDTYVHMHFKYGETLVCDGLDPNMTCCCLYTWFLNLSSAGWGFR